LPNAVLLTVGDRSKEVVLVAREQNGVVVPFFWWKDSCPQATLEFVKTGGREQGIEPISVQIAEPNSGLAGHRGVEKEGLIVALDHQSDVMPHGVADSVAASRVTDHISVAHALRM
jgi:hypothetical protein